MLTLSIKIINKLGLHARASAKLTQIANQFESDIWIEKNEKKVNAKSRAINHIITKLEFND